MTTESTTNWKPKNPCVGCEIEKALGSDECGCNYNLGCAQLITYLSAIAAQKKLLEYLIEDYSSDNLYPNTFKNMLKDLEGK